MIKRPKTKRREAWQAALLTVLAPGVGHVYCARPRKGLWSFAIVALSQLVLPLVLGLVASREPSMAGLYVVIAVHILGGIVLAFMVYLFIDSIFVAKRSAKSYQLTRYNRWYVYLGLIVLMALPGYYAPGECLRKYKIPSNSNEPTIMLGDRVIANLRAYDRAQPRRGEMVVFSYPRDTSKSYVKRLIGLPGDSIEIRGNSVLVNGNKLPRERVVTEPPSEEQQKECTGTYLERNINLSYQIFISLPDYAVQSSEKLLVPDGHYYFLGDNRTYSNDSRNFGSVAWEHIQGRLEYIYWSEQAGSRFGVFEPHNLRTNSRN